MMFSSLLTLAILSASRLCCQCTTHAFTPLISRRHGRHHRLQHEHRQPQQPQKKSQKRQDSILATTGLHMAKSGSLGCRPIGIGSATPSTVVTNVDLEAVVETSDEWISSRTGISRRHLLLEHERLSDLAIRAGRSALDMAKIDPTQIDLVVCATSTPDDLFEMPPPWRRRWVRTPWHSMLRQRVVDSYLGLSRQDSFESSEWECQECS
ncbi:beta-ketoacyl-acyl-carrier-protein synthase III [Fragilaria crotonensis]|nr:beta-ketoacyl-acyl-carrier-protein synthase III [Fragilaria crotonensis]